MLVWPGTKSRHHAQTDASRDSRRVERRFEVVQRSIAAGARDRLVIADIVAGVEEGAKSVNPGLRPDEVDPPDLLGNRGASRGCRSGRRCRRRCCPEMSVDRSGSRWRGPNQAGYVEFVSHGTGLSRKVSRPKRLAFQPWRGKSPRVFPRVSGVEVFMGETLSPSASRSACGRHHGRWRGLPLGRPAAV